MFWLRIFKFWIHEQQELSLLQMFIRFANQNLAVKCVKRPWNGFHFSLNLWSCMRSVCETNRGFLVNLEVKNLEFWNYPLVIYKNLYLSVIWYFLGKHYLLKHWNIDWKLSESILEATKKALLYKCIRKQEIFIFSKKIIMKYESILRQLTLVK